MGRLKRLVLYYSTGDVCFAEPNDRLRLFSGSDEIVGVRRLRPPTRNHSSACMYSVDIEYQEFLNRTMRVELDGDGAWGGQDLFLVGELIEDGRSRWLPLGHDLGDAQTPGWITQSSACQLKQMTEAERFHPLQDLVVTMSAALPDHDSQRIRARTPSGTVEMSVFVGENNAPAILYQTLRQVSFDGCHSSNAVWFFHLPVRGGIPFTADALTGAQFSVDLDSGWKDHVIRVFGIDAAAQKGRLLGCSEEALLQIGRPTDRPNSDAYPHGDLIPISVTSVRRFRSQRRPSNPWFTLRWDSSRDKPKRTYPHASGIGSWGR